MPPPPATPAPRAASCFAKEAVRQGRPEPPPPPFQPHPSLRLRQTKGGVLRSHQPSRTQEFLIGGKVLRAVLGSGSGTCRKAFATRFGRGIGPNWPSLQVCPVSVRIPNLRVPPRRA